MSTNGVHVYYFDWSISVNDDWHGFGAHIVQIALTFVMIDCQFVCSETEIEISDENANLKKR